jgi:hypothetical protein
MRPQASDWAGANGLKKRQPRRSVKERRLFAAFWDNLGKKIHAPIVSGVD